MLLYDILFSRSIRAYITLSTNQSIRPGVVACLLLSILFVTVPQTGQADSIVLQPTDTEFDHYSTGFQLTGQHQFVKCETCHVDAEFQSLPTDCRGCHDGLIARGKPVIHVQTALECENCHNVEGFLVSAIMDHTEIVDDCVNCHNGVIATGQTINHIATTQECQACHQTMSWIPVVEIDHNEVTPNACFDCHNDRVAVGKSVTHIESSNACETCHSTVTFDPVLFVNHAHVLGSCDVCHTKPFDHAAATNECESCHATEVFSPVLAVTHTEVMPSQCLDCHAPARTNSATAVSATTQPLNHILTGQTSCDLCHLTTGWIPTNFTHYLLGIVDNCVLCHTTNISATAKPVNHMASSDICESCHNSFTVWTVAASIAIDHTQVVGACVDCHNGIDASGKSATHINSTNICDTCHQPGPVPWAPVAAAAVDHTQVIGSCSSCHNNTIATGQGPTHITTASECDVCHITGQWSPAVVDHTTFVGNCFTCHDGIQATGIGAGHIPSTNECDACHQSFPATWVPVAATAVDHTQVIGNCVGCHNNSVASGKSASHISSTEICDACHQPGPTPWMPVASAAVDHTQVIGFCSSCHDGLTATGKTVNHLVTTAECDDCHSTDAWTPAIVGGGGTPDHTTFIGNCVSCHDTVIASGKSASHIPSSDLCDACHLKFPATWAPVSANSVDHTQVVGACIDCHNGVVAQGKPTDHIATSNSCNNCHSTARWRPVVTVDHGQVLGSCTSCHNGNIAQGLPGDHCDTSATPECNNCHTTTADWADAFADCGVLATPLAAVAPASAPPPEFGSITQCGAKPVADNMIDKFIASFDKYGRLIDGCSSPEGVIQKRQIRKNTVIRKGGRLSKGR